MCTPHPEERWSRNASISSVVNYLIFWRRFGPYITGWGFQLHIGGFGRYRRLQIQPSISGIGARPSIDRHMAWQPSTQSLHPLFRVRSKSDGPNLRHTRPAREKTGCGGHRGTVYWLPRGMSTKIYRSTNYADETRAMENGQRRYNWERCTETLRTLRGCLNGRKDPLLT